MLPIDLNLGQEQDLSSSIQYVLVFYLGRGLVPRSRALNKVHFHFQLRTDLALSEQRGGRSVRWAWRWQTIWKGKKRYLCQFAGRETKGF